MSFILDALKKAESERNRRVAPVLMDARIAPPRRGLPGWALALGAVLLVNLTVVTWLLLKTPSGPSNGAEAASPSAPAVQTAAAPANTGTAAPTTVAGPGIAPQGPGIAQAPPAALLLPDRMPAAPVDDENLPTLQDLRFAGVSLPELQLNLHLYDPAPANRWILLNGQRLREGEYTANGVKLERITPAGAVLVAGGRRFRLDAGG